jgi:hypothetical protein
MKRRVIYQIEFRELDTDRTVVGECYSDYKTVSRIVKALQEDSRLTNQYEIGYREVCFIDTEGGSNGTKS